MGLILLLLLAACLLLWMGVVVVLRIAMHPTRDGIGRALAQGRPCEPEQVGLTCETWSLRTSDGLDLPVWDASTGHDGPTVLWLHAWGQSRLGLLPRLPAWARWCGRIVMLDARGHGDAPGACSFGHQEREDLLSLLEVLGGEPVILAGEELGAVLALDIVMEGFDALGVFALDPFVSGSVRFRRCMRGYGFQSFPVADMALISLWLGGRSPIELTWPPSAPDVPVLVRFTGMNAEEEADAFSSIIPVGAPVLIERHPDETPDEAGAVDQPWW